MSYSIILYTNLFSIIIFLIEHSKYLIIFPNFIKFLKFQISEIFQYFILRNKEINSWIKKLTNSSFVILLLVILKFRNPGRSIFDDSTICIPPNNFQFQKFLIWKIKKNNPTI